MLMWCLLLKNEECFQVRREGELDQGEIETHLSCKGGKGALGFSQTEGEVFNAELGEDTLDLNSDEVKESHAYWGEVALHSNPLSRCMR